MNLPPPPDNKCPVCEAVCWELIYCNVGHGLHGAKALFCPECKEFSGNQKVIAELKMIVAQQQPPLQ